MTAPISLTAPTSPSLAQPLATAPTQPPIAPTHTIFIIEDDPLMAECIARATRSIAPAASSTLTPATPPASPNILTFPDALSATAALSDAIPDLIILDILLNGPDGFTFLNELISYPDTARIPVIIITSLNLAERDLSYYGVRAILNKDTMTPADIAAAVSSSIHATPSEPTPNSSAHTAVNSEVTHAR